MPLVKYMGHISVSSTVSFECNAHISYMALLIPADIVFNIEEYKVRVYKYRNRTIFKGNMSQEFIHSLLMVTSKCGEDYAMDLSSAQFRYDHPVDPWESYCINRGYEIKEIYGFGFHAAMCQNSGVKVVAANETIAHAMNDAVAKWENSHSRLSGLLK